MYQPRAFVESDLAQLDALFAMDPFVTLVTQDATGALFASHIPVLYRRDDDRIHIEGHWARPNPQASHDSEALMIVHGPHAYVSPGAYPDKESAARVPTWNYAVAHLTGKLEASIEQAFLASIVDPVPLELGGFQGLTGGHRLVQVGAGGVDLLGEQERRMDPRASQFAGVVIGRDVQVMLLSDNFDAALAILNVHRSFNVRTAVVFQPKVDWNCHNSFSIFTSLMRHRLAVTVPSCPTPDRHQPAVPD